MEQLDYSLQVIIEESGWLAPLLFILLHLFRPFLFIPVIVLCIAGGVLFGFIEGTILSFIGLSLMSLVFYKLINKFPKFRKGIARLKKNALHDRTVSVSQMMILRIMPFVHFHLLSLYLMEMTKSFRQYMHYSMLGVILPALVYTGFGETITEIPLYLSTVLILILTDLFFLISKFQHTPPVENK